MAESTIPSLPAVGDGSRGTGAFSVLPTTLNATPSEQPAPGKKRRNHRAGKKKKNRRRSFAVAEEGGERENAIHPDLDSHAHPAETRPPFYRLGQSGGRALSESSMDSEALLDHRDHPPMRTRRDSRITLNPATARQRQGNSDSNLSGSHLQASSYMSKEGHHRRTRRAHHAHISSGSENEENEAQTSDRTPLLSTTHSDAAAHRPAPGYGMYSGQGKGGYFGSPIRRRSTNTSTSSKARRRLPSYQPSTTSPFLSHDVNNPPSVPNSPKLGPGGGYDDVMVTGSYISRSHEDRRMTVAELRDTIVDIDAEGGLQPPNPSPLTARKDLNERRRTVALPVEGDVCFPVDGLSQIAEDEYTPRGQGVVYQNTPRRRRYRQWPDLSVLDEWSREEKEVRSEGVRAKKISEPVLVGGRLRPQKNEWHRAEEDAPYRFTYFNEEIPSTIHSQTISELLQPEQSFRDLFIPDPPELSDESSDEEDEMSLRENHNDRNALSPNNQSQVGTRRSSVLGEATTVSPTPHIEETSGEVTPSRQHKEKEKKYGSRPTFWLDVLSPTDTEMRVISKAFGIHPLTAEDILMQEAREKVELFRNYYLVSYRTFEQDMYSEDFLEPVNMYVVVFREGVISFHFSMIPHPANVRRRIRQLKDYLILSSDWISYAIIDDITDAFAPLIQSIEDEVDEIDDAILQLHSGNKEETVGEKFKASKSNDNRSEPADGNMNKSGSDMLRRVGEGRKKVMGLYRLMGNKADVIKGFAKRCNEHWNIAPKSEIGLYLGDIQDHILTMTSNLSHYETLLSRAHSNYLAQINIRMNERQEQTADVLGKLTVLGTIVLPMNIITGMWGMNVLVPGQDVENLYWFWSITAGLLVFGISCFFIAKRVYGIV